MTEKYEQESLPGFDKLYTEAQQSDITPEMRLEYLRRKHEQWKHYMVKARGKFKMQRANEMAAISKMIIDTKQNQ